MDKTKLLQLIKKVSSDLDPEEKLILKELLGKYNKLDDRTRMVIDFPAIVSEVKTLSGTNKDVKKALENIGEILTRLEAIQLDGSKKIEITNLKDIEVNIGKKIFDGVKKGFLGLSKEQTKQTSISVELAKLFLDSLVTLLRGLAKGTFMVQPTSSHYTTPQMVIVVDPITGRPIDWSRIGGAPHAGGFSAVQTSVDGTTNVASVLVNGTIDGVNTAFTLASTPANGVLYLSLGRQEQVEGVDYTRSGASITYMTPPDSSLSSYPHRAIIY